MMLSFVLAVNPILETGGQIAAIIICLFIFLWVVISLALHFALSFANTWVREKAELIKIPRPQLESVNKATEAALDGVEPTALENPVVRTVAEVPERVQQADQKVDQVGDRVAGALIEFRARTVQAQTILKAFVAPGATRRRQLAPGSSADSLEFASPGYRKLMEENASEIPVAPETGEGYAQAVAAAQLRDAHTR
jgi:hypothetical protein